mmetsp:Transcript_12496/g.23197  ORF Transcript_12496/g.23197 Transcript_12496/m.23197 type:complete len:314 (+) Transcript_12496:37-978(+)
MGPEVDCEVEGCDAESLAEGKEADASSSAAEREKEQDSLAFALPETKISFRRITELCLDKTFLEKHSNSPDKIAAKLLAVKVARLEWQGFTTIDCLDALTSIEDLYLQYNNITTIENLDFHFRLRFLALHNNRIVKVANIKHLSKLELLDLSNNCIEELDATELPKSLRNVDFSNNKCTLSEDYLPNLMSNLPSLVIVDDQPLPGIEAVSKRSDDSGQVNEDTVCQEELLDPQARTSKRPSSALGRSDAMMEAAMAKIESMCSSTSLKAKTSFASRREKIKQRSAERIAESQAKFSSRVIPTIENTLQEEERK